METFAIIMVLASVIAAIYGLINLAKPLGFLKLTKRRHGAALFGGAFVSFWVFAIVGTASQPGGWSAASTANVQAKDEAIQAEEKSPAREGMTQDEFNAVWTRVKATMEDCDHPLRTASAALGTGDAYAAFVPVKQATGACETAWLAMGRIDLPKSAKGDIKKGFKQALDVCSNSAYLKRESMKLMQTYLDGDVRPSVVSELQSKMESAKSAAEICSISFLGVAADAGLTLPELQEAIDKAAE